MATREYPMALHFQSLRSSSSGNCLMLWTEDTRILIDCGVPAQFRCRDLLEEYAGCPSKIDAVIVTHAHTDHIRYDSLRVFEAFGIPVHCHRACLPQIFDRHRARECNRVTFRPFGKERFTVGDFAVEPFGVSHHPYFPTCGFVIRRRKDGLEKKVVIATDFNNDAGLLDHFAEADFIFVEANHDPDLLRKYFNPNSLYHMENSRTGRLLASALERSNSAPVAIMLGHLSEERNSSDLALDTVGTILERDRPGGFPPLYAAPRRSASRVITIA